MAEQYKIPYAYDAFEPVIDALTMETHHSKHHATYTKTFNDLAQKAGVQDKSVEEVLFNLEDISDETLRTGLRNNGGGLYNHNLYFSVMAPVSECKNEPDGALGKKINETFGSFESFKEQISSLAVSQFGSGWAWLCVKKDGSLFTTKTPNQDNPFSLKLDATPIFCIDVWEHAYYLKFKNLRASYVQEFFKVVNWAKVEELYQKAL